MRTSAPAQRPRQLSGVPQGPSGSRPPHPAREEKLRVRPAPGPSRRIHLTTPRLVSSRTRSPGLPTEGADPGQRSLHHPGPAPSHCPRPTAATPTAGQRRKEAAPPPRPPYPAPATHVPDGEEDECGSEQERQHVAEGRECERHGRGGGAGSSAGASGERRRRALWVKPFTSRSHSQDRRRRRRGARPSSAPAHWLECAGAL